VSCEINQDGGSRKDRSQRKIDNQNKTYFSRFVLSYSYLVWGSMGKKRRLATRAFAVVDLSTIELVSYL